METKLGAIVEYYKSNDFIVLNTTKVDLDILIDSPREIFSAEGNHISFAGEKIRHNYESFISSSKCVVFFIESTLNIGNLPDSKVYILSENPKQDIVNYCKKFLGFQKPVEKESIHSSAIIHPNVILGKNTTINPYVVIESGVKIGDNCTIDSNTVIKANTVIGNYTEIGCSNVIGGTGFGFSKNKITNVYNQFPHYGKVIIGNHVSIGNNTCIDRGSLSDTIVSNGVKIDNLVHIAHNVQIGENSLIIADAMIAGSVKIGMNCWIAPSSCVRNGITIGDNATIGLASTVTKSVSSDQIVLGNPALPIKEFTYLRELQKKQLKEI